MVCPLTDWSKSTWLPEDIYTEPSKIDVARLGLAAAVWRMADLTLLSGVAAALRMSETKTKT
jgi:hypothetical protein